MEHLENHMYIWDSSNYTVVMIYMGSSKNHCRSLCFSLMAAVVSASELTTLHVCSVSVNVPVFSGLTLYFISYFFNKQDITDKL